MALKRQNTDKLSDTQLIWLFAETKNNAYMGELYLRYLPSVYGMFLNRTEDKQKAKEAVLGLFEQLAEPLIEESHDIKSFEEWLYQKCRNYVNQKLNQTTETETEAEAETEERESDDFVLEQKSLSQRALDFVPTIGEEFDVESLREYKERLSVPEMRSLELFFGEGMSFAEIAAETGYLHADVQVYIERGVESVAEAQQGDSGSKTVGESEDEKREME